MPWDPASVARAALSVEGEIVASNGPRTVLDVRGRSTIAVDGDADYVADVLAAGGPVIRVATTAGASGGTAGAAAGAASASGGDLRRKVAVAAETTAAREPFVVLVDAIGAHSPQRDVIEQLAAVRPRAIVVNVGMPGGVLPLGTVHTRAASRLAAEAVGELLADGARHEVPA